MEFRYRILISSIALFFATPFISVQGQGNGQLINSIDLLKRGIALSDSGAYDKASALFEQISRNDTNYLMALFEDAVSLESNNEDSLAIKFCNKGLAIPSEYEPDFYKVKAGALIDLKRYKEAVELMNKAIALYPNLFQLHFTMGLAFYKAQQYDSAIASFERAINLNIFHASSHYYLGRCCLEQGRIIPALLSLQFSLVLEPLTTRSFTTVQLIERVVENKYEFNKANKVDPQKYGDEPFINIELLVQSQAALNKEYKTKSKINYNVIKQCQVIQDKLRYVANTDNFWMNTYVPFFVNVHKKQYFEPYSYFIMQSVNDDDLQKNIKKSKKEIDQFVDWAGKAIAATTHEREIIIEGKKTKAICFYYASHAIEAMGCENAKGKQTGEWTFYHENNGKISAKGVFDDNSNRTGEWQFFYFDGTLKELTSYDNGKKNGVSKIWYENAAPEAVYNFKDDILDGEAREYNSSGVISTYSTYKQGKPYGNLIVYYADGRPHYSVNYDAQGMNGELKELYANGQPLFSVMTQSNKKNGTSVEYWPNGKIKAQGEYKDDLYSGHWKFYYADGALQKEMDYSKGNPVGKLISYYRNGTKEEEMSYDADGKYDGQDISYDDDGIKYEEFDYKKDELKYLVDYNKQGKIIYENKEPGKDHYQINYYPNGIIRSEGNVVNNTPEGEWKSFSISGILAGTENYSDGRLNGNATNYYSNGKTKDEVNYTDDSEEGNYKEYYCNGAIKADGNYIAGKKQGDWYYYDVRGGLKSHYYYLNNKAHGYVDFFNPNGNITEEDYYHMGYFDKAWAYDSTGKNVTYAYASDKGNGHYVSSYINGLTKLDRTYVSGLAEGVEKTYYYNQKLHSDAITLLGVNEGSYKAFYENGDTESIFNYLDGNLYGPAERLFDGNRKKTKDNYLADDVDGLYKEYYKTGNLKCEGQMVDGSMEGRWNYYSPDSTLCCVLFYKQGIVMGYSYLGSDGQVIPTIPIQNDTTKVQTFYTNGNKALESKYTANELNGKRIMYYSNGHIAEDENYYFGNLSGLQNYYYSNGKLKAQENYYMNEKDGKSTYYYDNGKVEHEENWILNKKQGTFNYYSSSGNVIKTIVYYNNDEIYELVK